MEMGSSDQRTDWETFAPRMFSLLIDEHGAEAALVMNFSGLKLQSRGATPPPPLPHADRDELSKGPVAVRARDGRVYAFGQVGANAVLVGVFPAKVSEQFAAAAVQAILLIL